MRMRTRLMGDENDDAKGPQAGQHLSGASSGEGGTTLPTFRHYRVLDVAPSLGARLRLLDVEAEEECWLVVSGLDSVLEVGDHIGLAWFAGEDVPLQSVEREEPSE